MEVNPTAISHKRERNYDQVHVRHRRTVIVRVPEFHFILKKGLSGLNIRETGVDDGKTGVRKQSLEDQSGSRKNTATDNAHVVDFREFPQELAKGTLMAMEDQAFEGRGAKNDALQGIEAEPFEPSKNRGPAAGTGVLPGLPREVPPMLRRTCVVFDMVAVIEEEPIVEPAVMAHGSAGVFVVTLQRAERQSQQVTRQIDLDEEAWCINEQESPHSSNEERLAKELAGKPKPPWNAGMMRQMPVTPESLREPKQQAQADREKKVPDPLPEERTMNEIVGDRVGIPPKA
jgi:hypothetical protein